MGPWKLPLVLLLTTLVVWAVVPRSSGQRAAVESPRLLGFHVVSELPHDAEAFTQGLQFERVCNDTTKECYEVFWESTGLYGKSSIRQSLVSTGEVRMSTPLDRQHFGEGCVKINDTIYQILWRTGQGFTYSAKDLRRTGSFNTGLSDGWGLTTDGTHLIVTDSGTQLYFIDPRTFKTVRAVTVTDGGTPVPWLNELEVINGELWANVWQTECIARVDLATGVITHWMSLHGLRESTIRKALTQGKNNVASQMDVLNGIAYDNQTNRIFVTGKLWPTVYVIQPRPAPATHDLQSVRNRCIPRSARRGLSEVGGDEDY